LPEKVINYYGGYKMRELEPMEMMAIVSNHNEQVGFAENSLEFQVVKLEEEVLEISLALAEGDNQHIKEELGDALWVLMDIAHRCGTDLQEIFIAAGEKNMNRYNKVIRQQMEAEGFTGRDAYQEAKRRRG
jgi:nucleoside triphosphate diphosphatase